MTDNETAVYNAILIVKSILPASVENVEDNEEIRYCIDTLTAQLLKTVGKRVVRESRKNG